MEVWRISFIISNPIVSQFKEAQQQKSFIKVIDISVSRFSCLMQYLGFFSFHLKMHQRRFRMDMRKHFFPKRVLKP